MARYVVASALLVLALAPSAVAAPVAKSCNLFADSVGDGGLLGRSAVAGNEVPKPNSPPLDIIGGNFATGTRSMVVTLQVESLDVDAQAAPSSEYTVLFNVAGVEYKLSLVRRVDGTNTFGFVKYAYSASPRSKPVIGTVDVTSGTISWTTSRANVSELLKRPRQRITDIHAITWNPSVKNADSSMTRTYVDLSPSCLRAR